MIKRCLCLVVVVMMTLSVTTTKVEAGWEGDIGGILTTLNKMYDTMHTFLNKGKSDKNIQKVGADLKTMYEMTEMINSTTLEAAWGEKGAYGLSEKDLMSAAGSAARMKLLNQNSKKILRDGQTAQALIAQIDGPDGDGQRLVEFMAQSRDAEGLLAAVQAGNQINALQVQQMMRLQKLLAMNQVSQTGTQAQQSLREQMALETLDRYYDREMSPDNQQGEGELGGLEGWNP